VDKDGEIYTCSFGSDEESNDDDDDDQHKKHRDKKDASLTSGGQSDNSHSSVESKLGALEGKCETLNTGWWSYQWCHKKEVKQFHVDVGKGTIDPEWSLGKYTHSARDEVKNNGEEAAFDDEEEEGDQTPPDDYFEGGQRCDETSTYRKTKVQFKCCNQEENESSSKKKKKKKNSGPALAVFKSITENELCSYEAVICTPLLCEGSSSSDSDSSSSWPSMASYTSSSSSASSSNNNKLTKEDKAFPLLKSLSKACLLRHEGWWSYEFCYQKQVRQFHVVSGTDAKGKPTNHIESEFLLGKAPPQLTKDAAAPMKDESKYIIPPQVDDPNAPSSIQVCPRPHAFER
jgi:hypothetical protein